MVQKINKYRRKKPILIDEQLWVDYLNKVKDTHYTVRDAIEAHMRSVIEAP